MLFDIHIRQMINDGLMIVRGNNKAIIPINFLEKYDMIQPGSLDVRLNTVFAIHKLNYPAFEACSMGNGCIDPSQFMSFNPVNPAKITADDYAIKEIPMGKKFIIPPFGSCLAGTIESVQAPNNICYIVDGKSTVGRLFLLVHNTAGYADAGFANQITLEITNNNYFPLELMTGMFIGQFRFFRSYDGAEAQNPYNGSYVEQPATQPPKPEKLYRWLKDIGVDVFA